MSLALDFYRDRDTDHRDLTRKDLLRFDKERLEADHQYIQWLFPTDHGSSFSPYGPWLNAEDIAGFRADTDVQGRLVEALDRMLVFYGLMRITTDAGDVIITPNDEPGFSDHGQHWLSKDNHNHLRLTRIIRCLALCGLRDHACALWHCLMAVHARFPNAFSARSISAWTDATSASPDGF